MSDNRDLSDDRYKGLLSDTYVSPLSRSGQVMCAGKQKRSVSNPYYIIYSVFKNTSVSYLFLYFQIPLCLIVVSILLLGFED